MLLVSQLLRGLCLQDKECDMALVVEAHEISDITNTPPAIYLSVKAWQGKWAISARSKHMIPTSPT